MEEIDSPAEGTMNSFSDKGRKCEAKLLCDILHCESAKALAFYDEDFYRGMPTLTVNDYGQGKAYYVATRSDDKFYETFINNVCSEARVQGVMETPYGVEATIRKNQKGEFLFILNHNAAEKEIIIPRDGTDLITDIVYAKQGKIIIAPREVMILELK